MQYTTQFNASTFCLIDIEQFRESSQEIDDHSKISEALGRIWPLRISHSQEPQDGGET